MARSRPNRLTENDFVSNVGKIWRDERGTQKMVKSETLAFLDLQD